HAAAQTVFDLRARMHLELALLSTTAEARTKETLERILILTVLIVIAERHLLRLAARGHRHVHHRGCNVCGKLLHRLVEREQSAPAVIVERSGSRSCGCGPCCRWFQYFITACAQGQCQRKRRGHRAAGPSLIRYPSS